MSYFSKIKKEEIKEGSKIINGEMFVIPSTIYADERGFSGCNYYANVAKNYFDDNCKIGDRIIQIWACKKAVPRYTENYKGGLVDSEECLTSWVDHGVDENEYIFEEKFSLGPCKNNKPLHGGGLFPRYLPKSILEDIKEGDTLYLEHRKNEEIFVFALTANQKGGRYSSIYEKFEDGLK